MAPPARRILPATTAMAWAFLFPSHALYARRTADELTTRNSPEVSKDYVDRIKHEGLNRSQVMQTASYLTDVIGPRLTGSPQMRRANEWTRGKLTGWGLKNARLETWGTFGRGWELKRFSIQVTEPQCIPLIAHPKAWSPGTDGPITREVVNFDVRDESDLEKYRGKLKGVIVLMAPTREVRRRLRAPGPSPGRERPAPLDRGRRRQAPRPRLASPR